ncbi:DNA gyrase inhibitor YacG [Rhodoferax sp.]|uniref:DNA gyrase inhibitor YacG n=1 Tax=Rhodoferax sp. TaxID=50421 RepID=UPI00284DA3B8|nr:DNA gyrase inhibitor YacG [Rhodoferax sp.]MDR3371173.1 DNA gyrase inhibitor YacG [Rhodoferax sp.]
MTQSATSPSFPEKWVTCPHCGGSSLYAASNVFRPFCSERCKQLDLGAWASEQFAVPSAPEPDDFPPEVH